MVHQCRVTLVTVIVLTLVTGSNSNFSFSNLISNYLTKYPSNVHNRHQKQFNQKPPLPPSHHQQSKNSRQPLSEVSRAFQLSSSLEKRNLNNKDVIKSVAQRNPIQQPVRIKLPDIINRQQNVNIKPSKNPHQVVKFKQTLSRNLQPSSSPPKFENRLKDAKQTGEIRMRLPPKFNSLFQTNEQRSGTKTATAILQRNLINSTMSRNQNSPPLFTDESPVMQDFRFQGKDKPIFITQQNSGMAQNQKNIGPLTKSNQINKFPADAIFHNRKNSSTQSSRIAKFPRTHIMAEEKKNKESLRPLLSSTENFFNEISTLRSTPRFDEFLSSKNFDDFIPGPNNYYNNNRDRDHLKSSSTKTTTFPLIPRSTTSSSKSTSPPPYKFFPPIYADSMLERFSDYKSPSKRRVTTKAASTATPFRNDQPQRTSLYQNLGPERLPQYSSEIRYSEPLSYPNPLDTSFRQDDVELFDPSSYHNFAFSKTLKSDGYSKGNKKKDFTSPSVPQVGENLNLPEDNFIQGQAIQSRFSQKNEHRFLSSDKAENDIQTNYWSQNSAINNIKSYEKPRKTEAINSLSLEGTDIFQNSNNNNYNENDGTLSRQLPRKMSTPVAKSGWTVLDDVEDERPEYGGDYGAYDDYDWSSYEYDYKYATRRSSQDETSDSTFSDLHFNILSSPADIPKIGISTDFKPIEVIYNEMFEGPQNALKPIKQARSFDFVASASDNNMMSTHLPFLPTPQPGMVHLRSYDKQNSKQQPQRKFSKRFLNIDPTKPKSIKSIKPNYLHGIHQTFLDSDFEIKKTRRKKKSFPAPQYAGPLVSSESILHAIVQSELMEN